MKCTHNDCFTCPYADCISGSHKTIRLLNEHKKIQRQAYQHKYYLEHRNNRLKDASVLVSIWITNGKSNKRISPQEFESYSAKGWQRGRTLKPRKEKS